MKSLTVREVRSALPRLDEILQRQGEIVLTRRGRAIARLLPVGRGRAMPSHADLRAKMPRLSKGSEVVIREERDAR